MRSKEGELSPIASIAALPAISGAASGSAIAAVARTTLAEPPEIGRIGLAGSTVTTVAAVSSGSAFNAILPAQINGWIAGQIQRPYFQLRSIQSFEVGPLSIARDAGCSGRSRWRFINGRGSRRPARLWRLRRFARHIDRKRALPCESDIVANRDLFSNHDQRRDGLLQHHQSVISQLNP